MTDEKNPVPQGRLRRAAPLAAFSARAAGERMMAALQERAGDCGAVERFHERTAERYTELLGHSKGVLMKVGQALSMVDASSIGNGGFSPYQKALARLQADAPPMEPALARDVLKADLGRPAEHFFADFADEPMAAASIGQVHHAVLHDGREVAVKIQYPGAAEAIRNDLANAELLTTFSRFAGSATGIATHPDLRQTTREISSRIAEEVDYRHEAASISAFNDLYRGHPFIRVPEIINEASGDRVLTMTYLDGLDWARAQQVDQDLKNTWAEVIWRFIGSSYRHANLLYGDPHPGNFCFGLDGRVGFVDFGCVKVLPERRRHAFVGMARATIDGRKQHLRDLMAEAGYFTAGFTLSADEAHQWMSDIFYEALTPQPVIYAHDASQRPIRAMIDIRSPDHPVQRVSMPFNLILYARVSVNINAIFATLGATVHARSITDDLDGIAEPITPLGKLHKVWLRERGLPYGLQPRDHL